MNVLSLYIFVVIFFSWASALERAEPINHHPVLSKTLFLCPSDLRHFFANYLLNNGEDHLVVANLMDHSSVNMLRKRYGHYSDDRLKNAMKLFDTNSTKLPQQDVN